MIINTIESKSILTKSKLPKVDYCINRYVGCSHSCVYCYACFMKRFTDHHEQWGEFVDVKNNASEVLNKELSGKKKKGIVLIGSVTDAYQPIEKKYGITRSILAVLLKHDFSISILTKSNLVVRDIDILKQFNNCEVGLTVTTLDNNDSSNFEFRASSPKTRIEALETLHNAGIKTYAFIGPILPGITDIKLILSTLQGKVDYIMAESLNLKCGNRNIIESVIKEKYPHLLPIYNKLDWYFDDTETILKTLCDQFKLELRGFFRH